MVLQHRVHGDDDDAVRGQDQEGGEAQRKDPSGKAAFRLFQMQRDVHAAAFQNAEHENTGGKLGQHGRHSSSCDIHMEQENEDRIQNDVDDGADQRGYHTKHGMSLGGDEIIHPHGEQGEKCAAGVDRQIGIRVGEGSLAGAEPAEQQVLGQKE